MAEENPLDLHPTIKPVAMVEDAIKDCSNHNDIILDSFLGSGTTLIAAEKANRICYGIEISPQYADAAVKRWLKLTGKEAINAMTGMKLVKPQFWRPRMFNENGGSTAGTFESSDQYEVGYQKPPAKRNLNLVNQVTLKIDRKPKILR